MVAATMSPWLRTGHLLWPWTGLLCAPGGVRGAAGTVEYCRGCWYRAGVGFIRCGCRDHAYGRAREV